MKIMTAAQEKKLTRQYRGRNENVDFKPVIKLFGGGAESAYPTGIPINVQIMLDGRVMTSALFTRAVSEIRTTQGRRN